MFKKKMVEDEIKKQNPSIEKAGGKVTVDKDGTVTVTYSDGSMDKLSKEFVVVKKESMPSKNKISQKKHRKLAPKTGDASLVFSVIGGIGSS